MVVSPSRNELYCGWQSRLGGEYWQAGGRLTRHIEDLGQRCKCIACRGPGAEHIGLVRRYEAAQGGGQRCGSAGQQQIIAAEGEVHGFRRLMSSLTRSGEVERGLCPGVLQKGPRQRLELVGVRLPADLSGPFFNNMRDVHEPKQQPAIASSRSGDLRRKLLLLHEMAEL